MEKWFKKSDKELLVSLNLAIINFKKQSKNQNNKLIIIAIINLILNLINMLLLLV